MFIVKMFVYLTVSTVLSKKVLKYIYRSVRNLSITIENIKNCCLPCLYGTAWWNEGMVWLWVDSDFWTFNCKENEYGFLVEKL